jgi:hypothetical protein
MVSASGRTQITIDGHAAAKDRRAGMTIHHGDLSTGMLPLHGRSLHVPAGLFVLRYVRVGLAGQSAPITVQPPAGEDGELIAPAGMEGFTLVAPGDGLVVSARRAFDLAFCIEGGPAAEPILTLEAISHVARPHGANHGADAATLEQVLIPAFLHRRGSARDVGAMDAADVGLVLLGHVSRRGDVLARPGEWLGGPDHPGPIEGLELRWPGAPAGFDVAMRLTVNDHGPRRLPEVGLGRFSGTRRRAAPIIAIDLQIDGRRPEEWVIVCEAMFEGQPPLSMRGTRVALRGRGGREALVGVKIAVQPAAAAPGRDAPMPRATAQTGAAPIEAGPAPQRARPRGGRVKVFRSPA